MVDHGPCHVGATCSLQQHGCSYWDAVHAAAQFPVVITNYAWWLTLVQNPSVVLRPTLLVLDEAHAAPDALADALGAEILRESVESVLHLELPAADRLEPAAWVAWATQTAARLSARIDGARAVNHDTAKKLRAGQYLLMALRRIGQLDARLLVVSDTNQGVRFDVVWAAPHAEDWLFRGARHVLLVSATFTPHTAELLGIMDKDLGLLDAGSGFPLARRPVYIAPALHGVWHKPVRVDHRMTDEQQVAWVQHVDRILASRADRKGIIHSVSYARRDLILSRSKYRDRMMTHTKSDTAAQIRKFKASRAGTVLVSPAVTTGYDFPYQEAEFQIVAKVPFPDARHPIIAARTLIDKRYPAHLAMQQLVQMTGRGMRAADDQCETFIVDDHARWFLSSHADLAPRWFRRAITRLDKSVPAPPPPLGRRTGAAAFQE
jgi:Rad3-related DNA helicase